MRIIDAHCHVGLRKYEPVSALRHHMRQSGVQGAVLIQYMGNADNTYLLSCMADNPGTFQAAMIVEPEDDGTQIRKWAERGIVGIRLPADSRSKGTDPLAPAHPC